MHGQWKDLRHGGHGKSSALIKDHKLGPHRDGNESMGNAFAPPTSVAVQALVQARQTQYAAADVREVPALATS
jgi:hypothetical protein